MHTGQSYDHELSQIFFDDLEHPRARPLPRARRAGRRWRPSPASWSGSTSCSRGSQPDALLILGDTNSCLAAYPGEAAQGPGVPHGGGQPLLRPARAGGDQSEDRRPPRGRQPDLLAASPASTCCARAFRPSASSRRAARCSRSCSTTGRRSRRRTSSRGSASRRATTSWSACTARRTSTAGASRCSPRR